MIDLKAFLSIGFIVYVIAWFCGPKRSELWRMVEDWGADNKEAALVREDRRAARKLPTATVSDNGREYVIEKGGAV